MQLGGSLCASGSRKHQETIACRPDVPGLSPSRATLPHPIRKYKASEKETIPDTNTIVCTFLLDGVSL